MRFVSRWWRCRWSAEKSARNFNCLALQLSRYFSLSCRRGKITRKFGTSRRFAFAHTLASDAITNWTYFHHIKHICSMKTMLFIVINVSCWSLNAAPLPAHFIVIIIIIWVCGYNVCGRSFVCLCLCVHACQVNGTLSMSMCVYVCVRCLVLEHLSYCYCSVIVSELMEHARALMNCWFLHFLFIIFRISLFSLYLS